MLRVKKVDLSNALVIKYYNTTFSPFRKFLPRPLCLLCHVNLLKLQNDQVALPTFILFQSSAHRKSFSQFSSRFERRRRRNIQQRIRQNTRVEKIFFLCLTGVEHGVASPHRGFRSLHTNRNTIEMDKYSVEFPKHEWSHRLSLRSSRRSHQVNQPNRFFYFFLLSLSPSIHYASRQKKKKKRKKRKEKKKFRGYVESKKRRLTR